MAPVVAERTLSFKEAHDSLRGAQKTARGAPAYSRWVNRPFGRVLAASAYRLGMTPNQVTAVSAVFTYSAIAVVALVAPSAPMAVLVAVLLLVGYALDSADGQLARLTRMGRPSGEWLDHVIDMGKVCLVNGAVAVSWTRWGTSGAEIGAWTVGLPVLFLAVTVLSFFGWLLAELLVRVARAADPSSVPPAATQATHAPALRSILRLPSDYGLFALTFLWFATPAFLITYGVLFAANVAILAAALPTWFGQVRASEVNR